MNYAVLFISIIISYVTITGAIGSSFHILYMTYLILGLLFIGVFMASFQIWYRLLKFYWILLITVPMIVLMPSLLNQTDTFSENSNNLNLDYKIKIYIGLHKYNVRVVVLMLLSNSLLFIMTGIYLMRFHKHTVELINNYKNYHEVDVTEIDNKIASVFFKYIYMANIGRKSDIEDSQLKTGETKVKRTVEERLTRRQAKWSVAYYLCFRILMLLVTMLCISDVCLVHLVLLIMVLITIMLSSKLATYIWSQITTFFVIILFVTRLYFRISVIFKLHKDQVLDTFGGLETGLELFEYYKTNYLDNRLISVLALPLGIISTAVLLKLVDLKRSTVLPEEPADVQSFNKKSIIVFFPEVTYKEAADGIDYFLKFMINYGFYKLGVEFVYIGYIILIYIRKDCYALIYSFFLVMMVFSSYEVLYKKWWLIPTLATASLIIIQYTVFLAGNMCPNCFETNYECVHCLLQWLYLPIETSVLMRLKLLGDFCVFMLISKQLNMFDTERVITKNSVHFPGGSNKCTVLKDVKNRRYKNLVHDFTDKKRNWLDFLMHATMYSHFWFISMVLLITICREVSVFSFTYVVLLLMVLWTGNSIYTVSLEFLFLRWNLILFYNLAVVISKLSLYVPICFYESEVFNRLFAVSHSPLKIGHKPYCSYKPIIIWDCLYFLYLIFQRRLFCTNYIIHIKDDAKTSRLLASRGYYLLTKIEKKYTERQMEILKNDIKRITGHVENLKAIKALLNDGVYVEPKDSYDVLHNRDYYVNLEEDVVNYFLTPEPKLTNIKLSASTKEAQTKPLEEIVYEHLCPCAIIAPDSCESEFYAEQKLESNLQQTSISAGSKKDANDKTAKKSWLTRLVTFMAMRLAKKNKLFKLAADQFNKDKSALKKNINLRLHMDVLLKMDLRPILANDEEIELQQEKLWEPESEMVGISFSSSLIILMREIYYYLQFHADILAYLVLFLYVSKNASLMYMCIPAMIFLWGSLITPGPKLSFWIVLTEYMQCIVLLRLFGQLGIIVHSYDWDYMRTRFSLIYSASSIFILDKKDFDEIILDFYAVVALLFLRASFEARGFLSNKIYLYAPDNEKPINALHTRLTSLTFNLNRVICWPFSLLGKNILSTSYYLNSYHNIYYGTYVRVVNFFVRLESLEYAFPADVYIFSFIFDLMSVVLMFFHFFFFIAPIEAEDLERNMYLYGDFADVPVMLYAMFAFLIVTLIVDRCLYIARYVLLKFILQLILLPIIHIYMFIYLPWAIMWQYGSEQVPYLWYLCKCVYFLLSAYEIRHGYPTRTYRDSFSYGSWWHMITYYVLYCPLIFQIVTLIDWCITKTSLHRLDWFKVETLFAINYTQSHYIDLSRKFSHRSGEANFTYKRYVEIGLLLLTVSILILPIILYSLFTYVNTRPAWSNFQITFPSLGNLYEVNTNINENDMISYTEYNILRKVYTEAGGTNNFWLMFNQKNIYALKLPNISKKPFWIEHATVDYLHRNRLTENESLVVSFSWTSYRIANKMWDHLIAAGERTVTVKTQMHAFFAENYTLIIPKLVPIFLKISNDPLVTPMYYTLNEQEYIGEKFMDVQLTVIKAVSSGYGWSLTTKLELINDIYGYQTVTENKTDYFYIYLFTSEILSIKILDTISNQSFAIIYWTLILVLYGLLRRYLYSSWYSYIQYRKVFSLKRVIWLLMSISLVRKFSDLKYEEHLYSMLMFLYQSPEFFLRWTQIQFRQRMAQHTTKQ